MDAKKFQDKYKDLELVPKRMKANSDAVNAAMKSQTSLKDIQQKYSAGKPTSDASSDKTVQGKDKKWIVGHFSPKNKNADGPVDDKLKMFDENGNPTAFQG
ncbi:MAG: hypothetical protein H7122_13420 [Chitinophagaceae bacterium]|nr:hypothetical protein [Chitinophagaceae bacterium]